MRSGGDREHILSTPSPTNPHPSKSKSQTRHSTSIRQCFRWSLTAIVLSVSSVVPPGDLAQRFPAESTVAGQRPGTLRASGGQAGQLFAGHAPHATAQLFARHATGQATEREA